MGEFPESQGVHHAVLEDMCNVMFNQNSLFSFCMLFKKETDMFPKTKLQPNSNGYTIIRWKQMLLCYYITLRKIVAKYQTHQETVHDSNI